MNIQKGQRYFFKIEVGDKGILRAGYEQGMKGFVLCLMVVSLALVTACARRCRIARRPQPAAAAASAGCTGEVSFARAEIPRQGRPDLRSREGDRDLGRAQLERQ